MRRSESVNVPHSFQIISYVVLLVGFGAGGIVCVLLFWHFDLAPRKDSDLGCRTNIVNIARALRMYHSDYSTLPIAPYDNGIPRHSWRVLILPYIEQQELYDQINLAQRWDSKHNKIIGESMPSVYGCPTIFESPYSNYLGFTGEGTHWQLLSQPDSVNSGQARKDFILLGETEKLRVHWMCPSDFVFAQLQKFEGTIEDFGLAAHHNAGFTASHAVDWNGEIHFLRSNSTTGEVVKILAVERAGKSQRQ